MQLTALQSTSNAGQLGGGLRHSSNVAEIEAVVTVLILALSMEDLPENLALIVDSRVAFYKVTGWLTHIHSNARLTGAAGYGRELIQRLNERGVTIHWIWVKGHAKIDGNEAADEGATNAMGAKTKRPGYFAAPTQRQAPVGAAVIRRDDERHSDRRACHAEAEAQALQAMNCEQAESQPWLRAQVRLEQVRAEEDAILDKVQLAKDSTQKAAAVAQGLCMTADQEERDANKAYQERYKAEQAQQALEAAPTEEDAAATDPCAEPAGAHAQGSQDSQTANAAEAGEEAAAPDWRR